MEPQLHTNKHEIEPSPFIMGPITNHAPDKGGGGLWTSSYLGKEHGSEWVQWCLGEDFMVPEDGWDSYLLYPSPDAKVYRIDNKDDLKYLCEKYPRKVDHFIANLWAAIDFNNVSEDYDAVHLTTKGLFTNKMYFEGPSLMSWDCESTHWFRWKFEKIENLGKIKYTEMD